MSAAVADLPNMQIASIKKALGLWFSFTALSYMIFDFVETKNCVMSQIGNTVITLMLIAHKHVSYGNVFNP